MRYEYDGCDQLSAIVYPDGTKVSYTYDKNDNLTAVTDRNGKTTIYVYDAINRAAEIHRPNGVSTYNTYNVRDQIVTLKNTCDECGWVISRYDYTYDENGRLLSSKEQEENSGLTTYEYTYDAVGNRLSYVKHTETTTPPNKTDVAESTFYQYNESNQLVSAELFDGKKSTTVTYTYDENGNLISEIGEYGTDQDGYLWQSYRYDAFGNATFGSPQYDNEYTFNGESYNPNIHSQYLRARYYDTVKGSFLTEDTYLGDIQNPLTLNRYSYCIGNPLFYRDPSGHDVTSYKVTSIKFTN